MTSLLVAEAEVDERIPKDGCISESEEGERGEWVVLPARTETRGRRRKGLIMTLLLLGQQQLYNNPKKKTYSAIKQGNNKYDMRLMTHERKKT